jgi:glycosyltransferase involved in cell wall biosynthesis
MKVVHVETGRHLYGGAQQVIYLVRGLQGRGLDNTIVCLSGSAIDVAARQQQLPVHNVRCSGDLDLRFMFRLRGYLAETQPDVVHCHSRRGADFLGGRAARLARIPALLSRRVDSRESRYAAQLRYAPFRRIIAISENVAETLRESSVSADRVVTIRSAVDTDISAQSVSRQTWLQDFKLREDEVVAVIAAQFIARKGHRHVLQAMPQICSAHPNFRLILFGKGPLERALREQVAQLGVSDHVQFAGFRDDIDCLLGCADLMIHPALQEGLGVAMLKGAAAGLPVVAFDIAGAKEAVVPDHTGLLVKAADEKALLRAVTHLIENPSERRKLGSAGQSRMRESFSIDEMVDRHIGVYESMTSER